MWSERGRWLASDILPSTRPAHSGQRKPWGKSTIVSSAQTADTDAFGVDTTMVFLVCRRTLRRRRQRRHHNHNCSRMHPTRLRKATARARTRRAARGRRAAASPSTASTTGRIVTELTHRAKGPLVVSRKLTTWFELWRQVSTVQRFGS